MLQPLRLNDRALKNLGFADDDIRNFSEIARWVDFVETIGTGTSLSNAFRIVAKGREMADRIRSLNSLLERLGIPKVDEASTSEQ